MVKYYLLPFACSVISIEVGHGVFKNANDVLLQDRSGVLEHLKKLALIQQVYIRYDYSLRLSMETIISEPKTGYP